MDEVATLKMQVRDAASSRAFLCTYIDKTEFILTGTTGAKPVFSQENGQRPLPGDFRR